MAAMDAADATAGARVRLRERVVLARFTRNLETRRASSSEVQLHGARFSTKISIS
jgi:hypothetical protein